jgi:hypothetical protein
MINLKLTNPIIALERRALAQISVFHFRQPPRRQLAQLGWAFRWVALTLAVGVYLLTLASAVFGLDITGLMDISYLQDAMLLLAIFSLFEWLFLTFAALGLAARSIARESQHEQHWALLRLTGIPAYQLVWGKGWAMLTHLWESAIYITALRVLMSLTFQYNEYWLKQSVGQHPPFVPPPVPALILLPGLTLLFTVTLMAAALAVGLLVSALSRAPGRALLMSGLGLLGLWTAIGFISYHLAQWLTRMAFSSTGLFPVLPDILIAGMITVIDGGTTLTGSMLDYLHPSEYLDGMGGRNFDNLLIYLAVTLVALGLYAALTVGLMRLTAWILQRRGMSA